MSVCCDKCTKLSTYVTTMISSCSLLSKQTAKAASFVGGGSRAIVRYSSSSLSKKAIANSKLQTFQKIISSRVSARRFEPNISIPDNVWLDILRMTMTSPSGFNLQPTHIILLRSAQIKSILSKHAMLGFGNQYRTNDASGIAIFVTDLQPSKRIDRIYDMERRSGMREDGYLAVLRVAASFLTGESSTTTSLSDSRGGVENSSSSTYLSSFLKQTFTHALSPIQSMPTMENVESWSYKNAGIMAQQYTMSATAHGLSTCMMEGYDARRVKEILRVPDRYGVPLMVATGYDYGTTADGVVHADIIDDDVIDDDGLDKRTPRLEMNELFFGDTFGQPLDLLLDKKYKSSSVSSLEKDNIAAA